MRVTVLFFAVYREMAGTGEVAVSLPEGTDVEALLAVLRERRGLSMLPAGVAVAVNRRYAQSSTPLSDGDEVALIPPVAGG